MSDRKEWVCPKPEGYLNRLNSLIGGRSSSTLGELFPDQAKRFNPVRSDGEIMVW